MKKFPQHFSLESKNVFITGSTGYLGRSMAKGVAQLGAHVIINGRNQNDVETYVAELLNAGYEATPAVFDINNEKAVFEWFKLYGSAPLHGLVNNAYSGDAGSVETAIEDSYRNSFEISVISAHRLLKAALPSLREAVRECGNASVVNIGSMYGMVSPDQRIYVNKKFSNPPFYGASKAALLHWTRYAACEFGHEAIRVNSISPGPFPSDEVQKNNPSLISALSKKIPMGRIGQPEEIQGPLSFLISDASTYINGTNLVVDGGWTCW